ncbi:MAG: C-GCAxxG-C-C family protein [Clostridia bacterium]|nr:C-GCAxxG-C-C family protein [Clostridia bacterium]
MDTSEKALSLFRKGSGFNCAQAVLAAYASQLNLETKVAFKIAAAFGGGIARTGGNCGAVSGALMVIGLRYGTSDIEDQDSKAYTYEKARQFLERFKELHQTVICRELTGYDISTPEGLQQFKEQEVGASLCTGFIRDAVQIVEEIIK